MTAPAGGPSAAKPHVLLVEDSALVREAMQLLFEETGHRVTLAGSIAEAVAACNAERPAIMLLDLSLPDGSGLDALPLLRASGHLPPIVVALTGHDDPAIVRRCLDAGCREVLLKPVPARELLAKVRDWLSEEGAARAGGG